MNILKQNIVFIFLLALTLVWYLSQLLLSLAVLTRLPPPPLPRQGSV